MNRQILPLVVLMSLTCSPVFAQEAVKGVSNAEALFKDSNPRLNTNKQAALHIMKICCSATIGTRPANG